MDHIKALQQIYAYVEAGDVGNAVMGSLRVAKALHSPNGAPDRRTAML